MAASVKVDGAKIEYLRKARAGLSRKDAATILDISPTALYMIERSSQRTKPATLKRIAILLKENPEDLTVEDARSSTRESLTRSL